MQWIKDPQRDSREAVRAAQQALVYAGFPHSDAVTEVTTHLHRVRAALAAPGHALVAGFLAGAAMAIGVLLVLTLALGGLGLVLGAVSDPGTPGNIGPAASDAAPAEAGPGSPLGILPAVVVAAPALGLAGAGMARVTRNRWRRAGVLRTFVNLRPGRRYLLEAAAVWLAVAGLIVLIVWALAGPRLGANVAQALAFFGIPVGVTALSLGFSNLYTWILPRITPVNAAAAARPIIERDAARQVVSDRDFYGRSAYDRTAYDRSRWADEVLATETQGYFADAQRRQDTARDIAQRSGSYSYGDSPWRRIVRYALIAGGVTAGVWLFVSRLVWLLILDEPGAEVGVIGLLLGLVLGIALTWVYARYFEGL